MAGIFNYKFKEKNYRSNTCVVKYWFGTKYFIWKAKHLKQSCEQVFKDLNRKIVKADLSEDDMFFRVVKHQRRTRVTFCLVEVLFQSDDYGAILAFDKDILEKSCKDPDCLNPCPEQYIPSWLKNVTPNKALESTIIISDDKISAKETKIEPTHVGKAVIENKAKNTDVVFDPASIAAQIKAIKNAKS